MTQIQHLYQKYLHPHNKKYKMNLLSLYDIFFLDIKVSFCFVFLDPIPNQNIRAEFTESSESLLILIQAPNPGCHCPGSFDLGLWF